MTQTETTTGVEGETTEAPKRCGCVARMNSALQAVHPGVFLLTDVVTQRPILATYRATPNGRTRRRLPNIFPTFCPFCGIKYGD